METRRLANVKYKTSQMDYWFFFPPLAATEHNRMRWDVNKDRSINEMTPTLPRTCWAMHSTDAVPHLPFQQCINFKWIILFTVVMVFRFSGCQDEEMPHRRDTFFEPFPRREHSLSGPGQVLLMSWNSPNWSLEKIIKSIWERQREKLLIGSVGCLAFSLKSH